MSERVREKGSKLIWSNRSAAEAAIKAGGVSTQWGSSGIINGLTLRLYIREDDKLPSTPRGHPLGNDFIIIKISRKPFVCCVENKKYCLSFHRHFYYWIHLQGDTWK